MATVARLAPHDLRLFRQKRASRRVVQRFPSAIWRLSVAGLALTLAGCGTELDDEAAILQKIDGMTEAIEQGDVSAFMAPVADDFVAINGRLDRRALGLLVRRERLARDAIRVRRMNTEIELVGDSRARATFRALATGGSGLLPDEGRFWRIETGWRRDGDDWKLVSAEWE